jgi:ribosomal protein S18 acetylase RimI-like enzyme
MTARPTEHHARIRPAHAEDGQDWIAMWRDFITTGPEPCAPDAADATWRRVMDPADPMKCMIAADGEGRAVGFALYVTHAYSWSTRPLCYLLDLYVRPEARHRGLGRALIESLAEVGREAGWLKIYWMTQADNAAAQSLYDKVAQRSPLVRYDLILAPH